MDNPVLTAGSTLFGTGHGDDYKGQLNDLKTANGEEAKLFRVICDAEYISIVENNDSFEEYEWAMELKWFATCLEHAKKWGNLFYPNGDCNIIEVTLLKESLKYMFYLKFLDNIGSAYAANAELLNKIIRRIRLI